MTEDPTSQRADLEKAVRTFGGSWDTERGLRGPLGTPAALN
ncbi:hypothetical protein ACFW5I_05185 [Streptomyces sp. NPDC058818]